MKAEYSKLIARIVECLDNACESEGGLLAVWTLESRIAVYKLRTLFNAKKWVEAVKVLNLVSHAIDKVETTSRGEKFTWCEWGKQYLREMETELNRFEVENAQG